MMKKYLVILLFILILQNIFTQNSKRENLTENKHKVTENKKSTTADTTNKKIKKSKPEKEPIDRSLLDENALKLIDRLNVKDMELRDVLRGIAFQYNVNIVAASNLRDPVTLTISNISVIDCLLFLIEQYQLEVKQHGNIISLLRKEPKETTLSDKQMNIQFEDGKLNVDIKGEELTKVARAISQAGNINIVIDHGVKGNISGFLQDIELIKGVQLLLKNNGFILREKDDVYYITYDRKTYTGKDGMNKSLWVTVDEANLISFDLIEADIMQVLQEISQQMDINLVTYETPTGRISAKCSGISLEDALNFLFKGSDFTYKVVDNVYIIGNKKISALVTNKLIKLNHIKAEGIPELLPEIVKRSATIKIIKEQNAIMAIATNDVISELENFLLQIDHPTPQILIEALVVDFNSSDIRELGLKMGTNPTSADTLSWGNFSLLDMGINESGKFYTQHDGASVNNQLSNFSNWIGAKNIGVLPDNFYLQIQAMESEGLADVRSKPQIATLNGHTASISIGTTQYYLLKSTTPISSNEDIVTQETERFEKVEANVTLSITPWVSASGEVTVEIHPEFKTPVGGFSADTPPTINTRVIDSTVRLKDGETIILGGLIEEKESKTFYKVPILGDIPLLGYLFRSRGRNNSKTEMMIYITPHVFYGDETDTGKWDHLKNNYKFEEKK
jgi:type IV pilus assembly protein PilQ